MPVAQKNKKEKKLATIKRLYELISKHTQIAITTLENVSSAQIQQIRRTITQNKGLLVIGKNVLLPRGLCLLFTHADAYQEGNRAARQRSA